MNVVAGIGMTSARTRARMVDRLRERGIHDEDVLAALGAVPRHLFVEEALASRAYEDTALPLGCSQTISQPYVVALMIQALRCGGRALGKTLEVGAGCAYQAVVLGRLASEVHALERIGTLAERARQNVARVAQSNVRILHGDGHLGLPEAAPFDSIIVAAATPVLPPALRMQLAPGGRMILPFGASEQQLLMIERRGESFVEKRLDGVKFVPLRQGVE